MVKVIKPKEGAKRAPVKKEKEQGSKEASLDARTAALKMLSQFYLGPMDLDMKVRHMAHSSGKEVSDWMAALELMRDLVIRTEDIDIKLRMYQGMVDLLAEVGQKEDLRVIQEIIARINLKSFQDMGFERVEVECAKDACPTCRKMAGKRFRIEEAMSTMPLPCPDCTTERGAVKGYCRCRYFAIF